MIVMEFFKLCYVIFLKSYVNSVCFNLYIFKMLFLYDLNKVLVFCNGLGIVEFGNL